MIDPDAQPASNLARNHTKPDGDNAGVPRATFHAQTIRPKYAFPGIAPLIDREAERSGFANHSLRSRVKGDWFVNQASNSLGTASHQSKASDAQASVDHAVAMRDVLVLAVSAIEAAILETTRQLNLPEPLFARREVATNGPRRIRRSVDPGE